MKHMFPPWFPKAQDSPQSLGEDSTEKPSDLGHFELPKRAFEQFAVVQ